jgi:hypothetical protein
MLQHPGPQPDNDMSMLQYVDESVTRKNRNETEIICGHSFGLEI